MSENISWKGSVVLIVLLFSFAAGFFLRGMTGDVLPRDEGGRMVVYVLSLLLAISVSMNLKSLFTRRGRTGAAARPSMDDSWQTIAGLSRKEEAQRERRIEDSNVEPETIPDDSTDADDEDMQPLAGDPDRISKIVKGLDALAKAQALRGALRKQPVELAPYLNNIVEKARESVHDKDITFNLECDSKLSQSVDPDCLAGIMTNLLSNAAKAVKKAGTVTVRAEVKGDHVVFAVEDTGTGIKRKNLPHIFERFYRGSGSGIGLGLTIVKALVDSCGGTIEVQTALGKGSMFTVRIPLKGDI